MLSSITPLGERAKGNSWTLTTSAYVVGSLLGGALLGLLASPLTALAGLLTPTVSLAVLALILLGGAAADRWGPAPPSIPRQVNENWLTAYRGWVYGFGFGTQLGFGLVTIITSWSMWTVVAAIILSSGGADAAAPWPLPLSSVIVGATFGLARGLVLLVARSAVDTDSLAALHRRIGTGAQRSARLTSWLLTTLGLVAVAALITEGIA
ncbi:MAG: hypothetical protein M9922_03050 [Microthrixaceae bacterium]|nr:hypothetical protein [Microthrixaceae bacterium]MCB1010376.1 hypothetical protein [Microthrixaceae bacterium]MCO5320359.1 hypothetical protein [Microthrixaceae bacterium]